MRLITLIFMGFIALPLITLAKTAPAFTAAELTAIHDQRGEPYTLHVISVDDEWRRAIADDLRWRGEDLMRDITRAAAGRFDGATIYYYSQNDTSLISYISALEVEGEIVLIAWHSTAFFEIPQLVDRRIALLDAIGTAFAPGRFFPGWAEDTFEAAIQGVYDYQEGVRDGPYPGWAYSNAGGIQAVGQSEVPDWVAITVTSLDCPPRYPMEGWAVLFMCAGS